MSLGGAGFEYLRWLETIAIVFSVIYIILRESEGDFRALFLIALALYVGQEALVYSANTFWIGSFNSLGILITFATSNYTALALIAAVYDPPSSDPYRTPMLVSCLVILLVSAVRALGTLPLPPFDRYHHLLGIVVLVAAMVYLAAGLFKTEHSGSENAVDGGTLRPKYPAEDPRLSAPQEGGQEANPPVHVEQDVRPNPSASEGPKPSSSEKPEATGI
jgi:hypothetical protein